MDSSPILASARSRASQSSQFSPFLFLIALLGLTTIFSAECFPSASSANFSVNDYLSELSSSMITFE